MVLVMTLATEVPNPPVMKIQIHLTKEKTILAELQLIPISQLRLNPNNVRFKDLDRKLSEKEMEDLIWGEGDSRSLSREIKFSNGLSEPPYVQEISDGNYIIIEGNRRIVCSRKVIEDIKSGKEKDLSQLKLDPAQCIILPKDVDAKSIAIFLARYHVSGKKEWAAFNQSAHVYDLVNKHNFDQDDVTRAVSLSKTKVNQMLKAYDTTLKYRKKYSDEELWIHRYSTFEELHKSKGLKDWANDPRNLEMFMEWVHRNQFPMAIKVRKLAPIVEDAQEAYKAMKKGATVDEAKEILDQKAGKRSTAAKVANDVDDQVQNFQELIQNFPRSKMREFARDGKKLQNIEAVYKEFGRLIKDIKTLGSR